MTNYFDLFTEEELIQQAQQMARTDFPNTGRFFNLIDKVLNDYSSEVVQEALKEKTHGMLISNIKITNAIDAFWETWNEMNDQKGVDSRGEFCMLYREPYAKEENKFTNQQHRAIFELYTCTHYDGILKWKNKPMDQEAIGKMLGYKKTDNNSSFRKNVLTPLVNAEVLIPYKIKGEGSQSFYKFNPDYVHKGRGGSTEHFQKLFQRCLPYVIHTIKEKEIDLNGKFNPSSTAIGTLNAIMQWAHYQTGYFVENPTLDILEEKEGIKAAIDREAMKVNRKKHKILSNSALRRIAVKSTKAGMNKVTFNQHMQILKDIGLLMGMDSGGNKNYKVFPFFIHAHVGDGDSAYTKEVVADFFRVWGSLHKKKQICRGLGLHELDPKYYEHIKGFDLVIKKIKADIEKENNKKK